MCVYVEGFRTKSFVAKQFSFLLLVFLNDYHLLLVPEMLRELIPDAPIGLFLHATFPSSEIFRCLSSKIVYNYLCITYV